MGAISSAGCGTRRRLHVGNAWLGCIPCGVLRISRLEQQATVAPSGQAPRPITVKAIPPPQNREIGGPPPHPCRHSAPTDAPADARAHNRLRRAPAMHYKFDVRLVSTPVSHSGKFELWALQYYERLCIIIFDTAARDAIAHVLRMLCG